MLKGLPLGIGVRKVYEACQQYGQILQVVIENAGVWEEPEAIALVEFSDAEDAATARTVFANRSIGTPRIYVD